MSTTPDPAGTLTQSAVLHYPGREPSSAEVTVRRRDARQRSARAAKTLAACWGLAIAAVFMPVIHFVLVPGLLVLGPMLAWSRLHEGHTLLLAEGACPGCGDPQRFTLGQRWRERTMLRCEACGRSLELKLPAEPAA